jgi:hypothetical protein
MQTSIPSWLEPSNGEPNTTDQPATHKPSLALVRPTYAKSTAELALIEITYEDFFESAIDRLALGHPLKDIIEDDPRQISIVDYLKWVRKDKTRKERVKEAEQIAAEILVMQTIGIAEGANSMEDVQRSTLRVGNNWRIAQAYHPEKFGKTAGVVTPTHGAGGIVINIGQVESPYAKDITPDNDPPSTPTVEISDVESRPSD